MGAHVTAVCSARNGALVRALGADVVLDYTVEDPFRGASRYAVIFDTVDKLTLAKVHHALVPNGTFLSLNPLAGNPLLALWARLCGRQVKAFLVQPRGADLTTINQWLTSGAVRPVIDRVYPLTEVGVAHCYSETGRVRGKLVLVVDDLLATKRVGDATSTNDSQQ